MMTVTQLSRDYLQSNQCAKIWTENVEYCLGSWLVVILSQPHYVNVRQHEIGNLSVYSYFLTMSFTVAHYSYIQNKVSCLPQDSSALLPNNWPSNMINRNYDRENLQEQKSFMQTLAYSNRILHDVTAMNVTNSQQHTFSFNMCIIQVKAYTSLK